MNELTYTFHNLLNLYLFKIISNMYANNINIFILYVYKNYKS